MVRVGNRGLSPSVGRSFGIAFILSSVVALASCNSATIGSDSGSDIDVLDKVRSLDTLPRYPQPANAPAANTGQRIQPAVFQGAEVTDISEARPQPVSSGNGFELNFENTPVATVAKVVLGDILQTGYTIDPRVQGTVSLVSVRPVAKSDIIFVLENALRISGIVLVHDTAGYRLTPLGDAVGTGRVDAAASSPEPGYGVSVVPLQYVSAQTLLKLMDSFATKPGMVRADTRAKPASDSGQRRGASHGGGYRAELRPRLDAGSIGRHFPRRQQWCRTRHRGARKNCGFG